MSQEAGQVHITLTLNDGKFDSGLDDAKKKASDFGKDVGGLTSNFKALARFAGGAAAAIAGAYKVTLDLANEGIKIGQTAEAFDKLAGSSEEADKWIRAIQGASRGSLTEFEATNQAIQLMTMGLAGSAEEAGRFMEVAAITKTINPELGTMENTITNIGLTLANDSWMRLDQLGVDATQAKKRIEELKREGMAMTEAFDVAVMEQLEANAAKIGTDVLEIGKNTTQMQTSFREAKDSASELALVIMEELSPELTVAGIAADQIFQTLTNLATGEWQVDVVLEAILKEVTGLDINTNPTIAEEKARNVQNYGTSFAEAYGYAPGTPGLPNVITDQFGAPTPGLMPDWWTQGLGASYGSGTSTMPTIDFSAWEANAQQLNSLEDDYIALMGDVLTQRSILASRGTGIAIDEISGLDMAAARIADRQYNFNRLATGNYNSGVTPDEIGGLDMARAREAERQQRFNRISGGTYGSGIAADELGGFDVDSLRALEESRAADALSWIADAFGAVTDQAQEAVGAVGGFLQEAEKYDSLEEKFGIAPDAFSVDVFREMDSALKEYNVDIEQAAQATQLYQLATGMATGASETFNAQMGLITEQFANGTLSAAEYANAVMLLSQQDFSMVDNAFNFAMEQGDLDMINQMLDLMNQVDMTKVEEDMQKVGDKMIDLKDRIFGAFGGGEGEGEGEQLTPIQQMLQDGASLEETMSTAFDPALADADVLSQTITDLTAEEHRVPVVLDVTTNPDTVSMLTDMILAEINRRGGSSSGSSGGAMGGGSMR